MSRGGEPVVKIFNGDYYLFISFQKGYWWSNDFANWTYVAAPNLLGGIVGITEIDGKLYNYAGNTENRVRTTDDRNREYGMIAVHFPATIMAMPVCFTMKNQAGCLCITDGRRFWGFASLN